MTRKRGAGVDGIGGDIDQTAVGYGRPPTQNRFQSGRSGNPGGRPKGSRNKVAAVDNTCLYEMILAESKRPIKVHDSGDVISISVVEAVLRTLAVNAAKGQPRAQKLFLDYLRVAEDDKRARHEDWLKTAIDYKTSKEAELAYLEKANQDTSHILPHPDDVMINMQTGEVEVRGPMTRDELVAWRNARALEKQARAKIQRCVEQVMDPAFAEQHDSIRAQANADLDLVYELNRMLGAWDR